MYGLVFHLRHPKRTDFGSTTFPIKENLCAVLMGYFNFVNIYSIKLKLEKFQTEAMKMRKKY